LFSHHIISHTTSYHNVKSVKTQSRPWKLMSFHFKHTLHVMQICLFIFSQLHSHNRRNSKGRFMLPFSIFIRRRSILSLYSHA
jgi:EamA domain-containing membrane protein RarD